MITELLIEAVIGVWLAMVSVLPPEDEDDPIRERFDFESAHGMFDSVLHLDGWIPMTAMIVGLAVLLTLRIYMFVWSYLQTIWKMLPFT